MLRTTEIKTCGNASFLEINQALNLEIELDWELQHDFQKLKTP
jgi:hypothetical protein